MSGSVGGFEYLQGTGAIMVVMHVCPQCGESADKPGPCPRDQAELRDVQGDEYLGIQLGSYRIARLLGTGGMGRVYLGVHPEIGSRVAIKIFSRDCDTRSDLVERFFAEARATNLIGHEHIINVLDVNRLESGRPYLVMEHLRGLPLSQLIGSDTLTDSGIVQLMLDVLDGLAAAHKHQIIHRDLKPDNIFVSPTGKATLLDFGVAKLVPEMMGDSGPTATGAILGTPHYMSPEQAVGDPVDARTDIYALGVILFQCFTGRRPFRGTSLYKLLDQHVHEDPPKPRSYRADISEKTEELILRALAKKPEERFQSAEEMRAALLQCGADAAGAPSPSQSMRIRIETADEEAHAMSVGTGAAPAQGEAPEVGGKEDKGSLGQTASTVAPGPKRKSGLRADQVGAKQKRRLDFLLKAGSILGVLAVLGYFGLRDDEVVKRPASQWGGVAGDASVADESAHSAHPMPSWDAGTVVMALSPDAALPPTDAALPDAAPSPKVMRPEGVPPLSLFSKAYRAAAKEQPDVALQSISIEGLTSEGRVILGEKNSNIVFAFHSRAMSARAASRPNAERLPGVCMIFVSFERNRKPLLQKRMNHKCGEVKTVSRPFCSMAKLMESKGKKLKKHLKPNSRIQARYSAKARSFSDRPGWHFSVDKKDWQAVLPCE